MSLPYGVANVGRISRRRNPPSALFYVRLHFVRRERIGIAQIGSRQFLTTGSLRVARCRFTPPRHQPIVRSSTLSQFAEPSFVNSGSGYPLCRRASINTG